MTTLASRRSHAIPAGYVALVCTQCQCGFFALPSRVPEPVVCSPCRRGAAWHEATKLHADVKALIAGEEPFDSLSQAERQEQLNAIFGTGNAPTAQLGTMRTVHVVYDEPLYDSGGYEPDAQTRDEIESQEPHPMGAMFDAEFGESQVNGAFD